MFGCVADSETFTRVSSIVLLYSKFGKELTFENF